MPVKGTTITKLFVQDRRGAAPALPSPAQPPEAGGRSWPKSVQPLAILWELPPKALCFWDSAGNCLVQTEQTPFPLAIENHPT